MVWCRMARQSKAKQGKVNCLNLRCRDVGLEGMDGWVDGWYLVLFLFLGKGG